MAKKPKKLDDLFHDTLKDWPAPGFVDTRLSEPSPLFELHRA